MTEEAQQITFLSTPPPKPENGFHPDVTEHDRRKNMIDSRVTRPKESTPKNEPLVNIYVIDTGRPIWSGRYYTQSTLQQPLQVNPVFDDNGRPRRIPTRAGYIALEEAQIRDDKYHSLGLIKKDEIIFAFKKDAHRLRAPKKK